MRESRLWLWHILSAIVILVFLGIHMGIMHMDAILGALGAEYGDPVRAADVFRRSRQLLFMISYIVLLGSALFHGLYGLRSMLWELSLSKALEKAAGRLCAIAGFALFIYGSYVAVAVFRMGEVRP
jgi:succinate dehydrogenase / fumarate reductase membrane anchor subunit